jgi:prevent-host-death family protein
MKEVGTFEAKNTLSALLDEVERGDEIVITRRGRPVAKLVPALPQPDRERARAAMQRLRERARSGVGPFDWDEWRRYRDEGRE